MSMVWNKLIDASLKMQNELEELSLTKHIHDFPWPAISYYNPNLFRRADLDIIDAREERKLWMMHLVVYPHLNDPAPIYGFDVIAGPKKVTGAFHDYSPVDPNHFMMSEFHSRAAKFIPSKKRDLPDWAKAIFSGSMISAGNVRDGDELQELLDLCISNLQFHLKNIGASTTNDYTDKHNWYAINQKKNPHTPRVMENMGVAPDVVRKYIDECLFPEVT